MLLKKSNFLDILSLQLQAEWFRIGSAVLTNIEMLKDAEALFAECKDTYIALVEQVELYTSVVYKELERHVEDKVCALDL